MRIKNKNQFRSLKLSKKSPDRSKDLRIGETQLGALSREIAKKFIEKLENENWLLELKARTKANKEK